MHTIYIDAVAIKQLYHDSKHVSEIAHSLKLVEGGKNVI